MSTENNIAVRFGRQQHNHPADHTQIVEKQIMNLVTERCTIRPRTKKYLNIDRRLATLKDRYQTGVIDLQLFMQTQLPSYST